VESLLESLIAYKLNENNLYGISVKQDTLVLNKREIRGI
jgi:hypothetical protein